MNMVKTLEIHTYGVWGVPVEAVREIHSSILNLLEARSSMNKGVADRRQTDKEDAIGWRTSFRTKEAAAASGWLLVFDRL
jgi:hypothetical protein